MSDPTKSFRANAVRYLDQSMPRTAHALRRLRSSARRFLARDAIASNRRAALESEPWFIDDLRVSEGEVILGGWAFPPLNGTPRHELTLNGHPFEDVRFISRPDVAAKFWQREGAENSGFICHSRTAISPAFQNNFLTVSYCNPPNPLPGRLRHSWYLCDPAVEAGMPSSRQRQRVVGNDDSFGFLLTGATDFNRLENALIEIVGRGLVTFDSVLDWGVGCGRIARYATQSLGSARYTGCDVDGENIQWCQANLPGEYRHTGMYPPLPFPDQSFDLVYGISVFTHLREHLQDVWLEELKRIMRPGAIALVTTHGRTAIEYAGLKPTEYVEMIASVQEKGILVSGGNAQLDGAVRDAHEYLNVFHSREYIARKWTKWLCVEKVIPGYIFTHDLVVLKRR